MRPAANQRPQDHHVQRALQHLAFGWSFFPICLSTRSPMGKENTPLEVLWEGVYVKILPARRYGV